MAKRYDRMTPVEQRRYDCMDIAVLRCLDRGWSYARITRWLGVNSVRIRRVKECLYE